MSMGINKLPLISSPLGLAAVVLCTATLLCVPVESNGIARYREFVADPPFVKKLVFGQSGNLFPVVIEGQEPRWPSGFVLFQAAVQPGSWYLQIVTNAPLGPKSTNAGNGYTTGKCADYYWGLSADRRTISKTPATGEKSSGPRLLAEWDLRRIDMVRRLGLIYLEPMQIPDVPESITWINDSNFIATTLSKGLMTGKIVELTNTFPREVQFYFSKIPDALFSVVYGYDPSRDFPPASIKCYKTVNGQKTELWEFQLHEIETGVEGAGFTGYTPEQFMSKDELAKVEVVTVDGNNITSTMPDGTTIKRIPTMPDYASLTEPGQRKHSALIRGVLFAAVIISLILAIFVGRRVIRQSGTRNP